MLKSFDRAFWMKYLRDPSESDPNCIPLHDSDNILCCAFGDPQKASILDLKLKKLQ